ncbi:hypothetical protein ACLEPN_22785 [Myxococcus sp. 1LA]
MSGIEQFEVPPEVVAAHEAGHAVVALACGIPVDWVEVRTYRPTATTKRFGWTEALENHWMESSPLPHHAKILRRVLLKAGGLAGELVADVFDAERSRRGAMDDIGQMGAGLVELSLLASTADGTLPEFVKAVLPHAVKLIERDAPAFHALRQRLINDGRVDRPTMTVTWNVQDDGEFAAKLQEVKCLLKGP